MTKETKRMPITVLDNGRFGIPHVELVKKKGLGRVWAVMMNPRYWFTEGKRVLDAIELVCPDDRFWDMESDYYKNNGYWLKFLDYIYYILFFAYCYVYAGVRDYENPEDREKMLRIWEEMHLDRDWMFALKNMIDTRNALAKEDPEKCVRMMKPFDRLKESGQQAIVADYSKDGYRVRMTNPLSSVGGVEWDTFVVKGVHAAEIRYAGTLEADTAEGMFLWKVESMRFPVDMQGTAIGDYGLSVLMTLLERELGKDAVDWGMVDALSKELMLLEFLSSEELDEYQKLKAGEYAEYMFY